MKNIDLSQSFTLNRRVVSSNDKLHLHQIIGGPIFSLRMQAHVTMPDLFVSSDTLDFGDVKCGECCIITIQLFNNNQVPCSWTSRPSSAAKKKVRISARSFNEVKLI